MGAQERSASAELGVASLRQPGSGWRDALLGGVRGKLAGRAWSLGADALGTLARDSVSAVQGTLLASLAPPRARWLRTEATASRARFDFQQVGNGTNDAVTVRRHVAGGRNAGAWVSAERGWSARQRVGYTSESVGATAWGAAGPAVLLAGLMRGWSDDARFVDPGLGHRDGTPVRYEDMRLALSLTRGRFDLTTTGVRRTGPFALRTEGGAARLMVRLTPSLALEATHARQLGDPVRGIPEARLNVLSARVTATSRFTPVVFRPFPGGGGEVTLRVHGAGPWEVAGSFNDWTPQALRRAGRDWVTTVRLPSGVHRIAVRAAGGAWRAPAGLPRARDDFDGEHGVVVVP